MNKLVYLHSKKRFNGNTLDVEYDCRKINLLKYSENFNKWSVYNINLIGTVLAPDGKHSATILKATSTDPYLRIDTPLGKNISGLQITFSCWCKSDIVGKKIKLTIASTTFGEDSSSITLDLTNNYQRLYFTKTFLNGLSGTGIRTLIEVPDPAVVDDEVHLWGAQLNFGEILPYEKTNGNQVLWNSVKQSTKIINKVQNGIFENGITGWSTSGDVIISALNNELIMDFPSTYSEVITNINVITNHKYYFAGWLSALDINSFLRLTGNVNALNISHSVIGGYNYLSAITDANATGESVLKVFRNTGTVEQIKLKEAKVIDLTEFFGAGSEPNLEQCDEIFKDWFDGTVNLIIPGKINKNYYQANNSVQNGDFSNGVTDWLVGGAQHSTLNNILSVIGNGTSSVPKEYQTINIPCSFGKKIYIKAKIRVTNNNCNSLLAILSGSVVTGTVQYALNQNTPVQDQWYYVNSIIILPADMTGNLKLTFQHSYTDNTIANGKIMEIQEVMAIDLTNLFGENNEPNIIQCDQIFTNWFDETQQVEYKRYLGHGILGTTESADINDPLFLFEGLLHDGIDDRVIFSNQSELNFGLSPFTIDVVLKSNNPAITRAGIFSKGGHETNLGFYFRIYEGRINGYLNDGINKPSFGSDILVNDGLYHHVIITTDRKTLLLYIDGKFERSIDVSVVLNINSIFDAQIGIEPGGARSWSGVISYLSSCKRYFNEAELINKYNYVKTKLFKSGISIQ